MADSRINSKNLSSVLQRQYGFDPEQLPDDEPDDMPEYEYTFDDEPEAARQAAQEPLREPAQEPAQEPSNDAKPVSGLLIRSASQLVQAFPKMRPVVIEGYLRIGETMNVIASPKVGKSWLVLGLAFQIAMGRKWFGAQCEPGRVLIIDNELHEDTLSARLAVMMQDNVFDEPDPQIDVISIRGQNVDIVKLATMLSEIKPGTYSLIVLDALYRLLTAGTSENDNAQMMAIYNLLDSIAKQLHCAIAVIHHASKGSQSNKSQTDVGSGAGAISRAADTHLTIRPHEEEGYFVLEAVTRSFRSPDPKSIYFKFPRWEESDVEAKVKPDKKSQQDNRDIETRDMLLDALKSRKTTTFTRLKQLTGFGQQRVERGVALLKKAGLVSTKRVKSPGKGNRSVDVAKLLPKGDSVCDSV